MDLLLDLNQTYFIPAKEAENQSSSDLIYFYNVKEDNESR